MDNELSNMNTMGIHSNVDFGETSPDDPPKLTKNRIAGMNVKIRFTERKWKSENIFIR